MEENTNYRLPVYILLVFLNLLPVGIAALIYRYGGPVEIPVYAVLIIALSMANLKFAKDWPRLLILSVELVISIAAATALSTYLYTHFISDDGMSYTIGIILLIAGAAVTALIGTVSVIVKAVTDRKYDII